jgi:hypothetical protein
LPRRASRLTVTRYAPSEPVFMEVPVDLQCMVASRGPSPEPAGSPVKAALYLKQRPSVAESSDSGLSDGSALSDVTNSARASGRGESKTSSRGKPQSSGSPSGVPRRASSTSDNSQGGFSDVSADASAAGSARSPTRSSPSRLTSKEPVQPTTKDSPDEDDPDLLSNPFASDSEDGGADNDIRKEEDELCSKCDGCGELDVGEEKREPCPFCSAGKKRAISPAV